MKVFKRALSCFMAVVMAVTMMCGLAVSAGAEKIAFDKSDYSMTGKYDEDAFVIKLRGISGQEAKERLIAYFNGEYCTIRFLFFTSSGRYCLDFTENMSGTRSLGFYKCGLKDTDEYERLDSGRFETSLDANDDETCFEYTIRVLDRGDDASDFIEALKNSTYLSVTVLHGTVMDGTICVFPTADVTKNITPEFDFSKKVSEGSSKKLSSLKISTISDKTYTGKAIKPSVTVKNGSKTLKNGTDYTLTYKNNTKIGKASVTIKGKGDYTGSKTIDFNIVPAKTTLKATKKSDTKAVLSWSAVKGAEKYQIYYSVNGGKYKKLATVSGSKTSYTNSKLDFKKNDYKFKIRAYAKADGKTVYGAYSKVVTVK
ncbi:MAG: hypothetical protein ACI4J4_01175 [Ruminiclostridium sp.]